MGGEERRRVEGRIVCACVRVYVRVCVWLTLAKSKAYL